MASKWLLPPVLARFVFMGVILGGLVFAAGWSISAQESVPKEVAPSADFSDSKEALSSFHDLIGEWRGVGMPRRGSRVGAWIESAEWVWDFREKAPALRYDLEKSQLLKTARLTWNPDDKQFHLKATLPDEKTRDYRGTLTADDKLILESAADAQGTSHRITLTRLNQKRVLVLHEQRTGQALYRRVAEVGYTREGTSLAVEGAGERECVVTGGKGTIAVSYQGKAYFVCCSGCKQAFDDDPAGIIADYEKRLAERKAKHTK